MKKLHTKTTELSAAMLDEIRRLQAMPESTIDTMDIPEADLDNMKQGFRGAAFKSIKAPVTIRLDTDVIAWFRENAGDGRHQTAINQALREFIANAERKPA